MNKLIWKFDILIYKLFRWRWNDKLKNNPELRALFLKYFTAWESTEMPDVEDECK